MIKNKIEEIYNSQGSVPHSVTRDYDWFTEYPVGKEKPGWQQCGPRLAGDDIRYWINSAGFRGKEFDGNSAVFGDSFVFGIGVENCFAAQLDVDNLGVPATSNDAIARRVIGYLNYYKPTHIVVMWTYGYRREWVTESGNTYEFKRKFKGEHQHIDYALAECSNDAYDYYNWQKNQLLVQQAARLAGVHLTETNNHIFDPRNYTAGSDGKHPGQDWHDAVAQHLKEKINAE